MDQGLPTQRPCVATRRRSSVSMGMSWHARRAEAGCPSPTWMLQWRAPVLGGAAASAGRHDTPASALLYYLGRIIRLLSSAPLPDPLFSPLCSPRFCSLALTPPHRHNQAIVAVRRSAIVPSATAAQSASEHRVISHRRPAQLLLRPWLRPKATVARTRPGCAGSWGR